MAENEMCCPPFNPAPWDGITHEWKDKPFITDSIPQVMHIPLPGTMKKMMTRIWKKAEDLGEDRNLERKVPQPRIRRTVLEGSCVPQANGKNRRE